MISEAECAVIQIISFHTLISMVIGAALWELTKVTIKLITPEKV